MKDILQVLRELCYGHTHSVSRRCYIADAADEIERLRKELKIANIKIDTGNLINDFIDELGPESW